MAEPSASRFYEYVRVAPTPADSHYVEGCRADLYFPVFGDIDLDQVADLGSTHVLLDVDGTLAAHHDKITLDEPTARKLQEIEQDPRFETLSLATENGAYPRNLLDSLGISRAAAVFQPWEAGTLGLSTKITERFWKKVLFELDCFEEPHQVVMIGDSLVRDIQPAQALGLKTVLVDRLERRFRGIEQILADMDSTEVDKNEL